MLLVDLLRHIQGDAMPKSLKLAIVTTIVVHVAAIHASADPIRVVSGILSFDTGDPPSFRLLTSSGQLFEAEGFRLDWPATCFFECSPGEAIPLSSTSSTQFDGSMVFRADGVEAFPVMHLAISAPSVTVGSDPGTPNGPFGVMYRRPFTFAGQLAGYASEDRSGAPLFDLTLVGNGTATLRMGEENGLFSFSSLDYEFAAGPVPEPGTLLLAATGVAAFGRRVWKGRRRE